MQQCICIKEDNSWQSKYCVNCTIPIGGMECLLLGDNLWSHRMGLHASTLYIISSHTSSSPFSSATFESSLLFWQFLHPCCLQLASVWLCIAHFQVSFLISATVFSNSLSLTASPVLSLTSFAAADSCLHLWKIWEILEGWVGCEKVRHGAPLACPFPCSLIIYVQALSFF